MGTDDEFFDSQSNTAVCTSACSCTPAVPHRCATKINCSACSKPSLVACLLNQYRQSSTLAQKYECSNEWIYGFISHSGLRYTCQECKLMSRAITNSDNTCGKFPSDLNTVKQAIADCDSKITKIDNNLNVFQNAISAKLCSLLNDIQATTSSALFQTGSLADLSQTEKSEATTDKVCKPIGSYADAMIANITGVVKSTLTDGFKEQHKVCRDSASLVIYGLNEEGQDHRYVSMLFSELNCKLSFNLCSRLGRATSSRARPLKVEMHSVADRDKIIVAFIKLQRTHSSDLRIAKWLQKEELDKIKKLRERCCELNDKACALPNGKKPYVVISGRIRVRTQDGKLRPWIKEPPTSSGVDEGECSRNRNASQVSSNDQKKNASQASLNAQNNQIIQASSNAHNKTASNISSNAQKKNASQSSSNVQNKNTSQVVQNKASSQASTISKN